MANEEFEKRISRIQSRHLEQSRSLADPELGVRPETQMDEEFIEAYKANEKPAEEPGYGFPEFFALLFGCAFAFFSFLSAVWVKINFLSLGDAWWSNDLVITLSLGVVIYFLLRLIIGPRGLFATIGALAGFYFAVYELTFVVSLMPDLFAMVFSEKWVVSTLSS